MPRVIAIAEVEDGQKWEQGFRTHGELFKSQTVKSPVQFAVDGNRVAILFEPDDLDKFIEIRNSPATAEAMEFDGVKRETVQFFVLDKDLHLD